MAISFEILGARPNFASKDEQNYCSKDFSCSEIFLDFCEKQKSARKVSIMQ